MNEKFLHFIWKHQLFEKKQLLSSDLQTIQIVAPGTANNDSGPDFSNAKIRIGDTLWIGQVEIHINGSDYLKHGHERDAAYANVILHVVYTDDLPPKRLPFPTLALKGLIPLHYIRNYEALLVSRTWIPCANQLPVLEDFALEHLFARLAGNRLERKTTFIAHALLQNNSDWEETFYQLLGRSLGMKVNGDTFYELTKRVPLKLLSRHRRSRLQLEALLLGTAGLLQSIVEDTYVIQLQREYQFLQHKYQLEPLTATQWKFARMRPANFPTIKIAQLAAIIENQSQLFSKVCSATSIQQLKQLFEAEVSDYWKQHYHCNKLSIKREKHVSGSTQELIIINTVIPVLFAYSLYVDEDKFRNKALYHLESTVAEDNKIIRQWESLGIKAKNAMQSQALLELKHEYCDQLKCEQCMIGMRKIQMNN